MDIELISKLPDDTYETTNPVNLYMAVNEIVGNFEFTLKRPIELRIDGQVLLSRSDMRLMYADNWNWMNLGANADKWQDWVTKFKQVEPDEWYPYYTQPKAER